MNKRTVEALVKAGAFDSLQRNRAALLASIDRAFDFAAACEANANQGGLFDALDGDAHGASTQEPELVDAMPWDVREQLTAEKTAVGFYLSGHLFDAVEREVRRFVRRRIAEVAESAPREGREGRGNAEPVLLAGIVSDLRVINGQRGRLALFKLDDKSAVIDARLDEALLEAHRSVLRDDELIIVQGRALPDRFSGGMMLSVQQLWDLPAARCRFGKYLRVAVNGTVPRVHELLAEFPPRREVLDDGEERLRGLPLRLRVERHVGADAPPVDDTEPCASGLRGVRFELALNDAARTYPSDAALAHWSAQAAEGLAEVVYE